MLAKSLGTTSITEIVLLSVAKHTSDRLSV